MSGTGRLPLSETLLLFTPRLRISEKGVSMSEERRLILRMLVEGKLTVEEADRLLAAVEGEPVRDPWKTLLSRLAHKAGDEARRIRERLGGKTPPSRSTLTVEEDSPHDVAR